MEKFFFYFGILAFVVTITVFLKLIWEISSPIFEDIIREYRNYCFLKNINMTEKEFDEWMINVRLKMTDEEYAKWSKKNLRFYYSWIPFKVNNKF